MSNYSGGKEVGQCMTHLMTEDEKKATVGKWMIVCNWDEGGAHIVLISEYRDGDENPFISNKEATDHHADGVTPPVIERVAGSWIGGSLVEECQLRAWVLGSGQEERTCA